MDEADELDALLVLLALLDEEVGVPLVLVVEEVGGPLVLDELVPVALVDVPLLLELEEVGVPLVLDELVPLALPVPLALDVELPVPLALDEELPDGLVQEPPLLEEVLPVALLEVPLLLVVDEVGVPLVVDVADEELLAVPLVLLEGLPVALALDEGLPVVLVVDELLAALADDEVQEELPPLFGGTIIPSGSVEESEALSAVVVLDADVVALVKVRVCVRVGGRLGGGLVVLEGAVVELPLAVDGAVAAGASGSPSESPPRPNVLASMQPDRLAARTAMPTTAMGERIAGHACRSHQKWTALGLPQGQTALPTGGSRGQGSSCQRALPRDGRPRRFGRPGGRGNGRWKRPGPAQTIHRRHRRHRRGRTSVSSV